jgi:hypothetical protein
MASTTSKVAPDITGDAYGGYSDVVRTVASPATWNLCEQTRRLSTG